MDMTLVKMWGPATLSEFQPHRRVPRTPTSCLWKWHWFRSSNDSESHLAIYLNKDQETSYSWRTLDKLMMTHKHQPSDQNSKDPTDKYSRERLLRTLQGQLSTHRFSSRRASRISLASVTLKTATGHTHIVKAQELIPMIYIFRSHLSMRTWPKTHLSSFIS